jgi:hypothetical protein
MNIVDITDSAFSLANIAASSDIIKEMIPDAITDFIPKILPGVVPDIIPEALPDFISGSIPDFIPDFIPDIVPDIVPDIPDILHDENTIYIFLSIIAIIFLIGVFIYNYLNKNKRVRFEENQVDNNYYNDSRSRMSDF